MSFFENPNDIRLLQNLLAPEESDESDIEDDRLPKAGVHKFGPGNIAPIKPTDIGNASNTKNIPGKDKKEPSTIEEWEQEQLLADDESGWDNRKTPEYQIRYKQAIKTEDVYLQMGNKTGSTASCEDMIIEINLPNETMRIDEMTLSVAAAEINLSTRLYKLKLPLVHTIDPDQGKAEYDSDKQILKLNLRLVREFDFVNF